MLGGYGVYFILSATQNYFLSVVLGTLLIAVFGGLLLAAIIWPLLGRSQVLILLATLGLSLILEQGATNFLGGDTKIIQPPLNLAVPIGPIRYPAYDLVVVAAGQGDPRLRRLGAADSTGSNMRSAGATCPPVRARRG